MCAARDPGLDCDQAPFRAPDVDQVPGWIFPHRYPKTCPPRARKSRMRSELDRFGRKPGSDIGGRQAEDSQCFGVSLQEAEKQTGYRQKGITRPVLDLIA
jgi:hypothetical protein